MTDLAHVLRQLPKLPGDQLLSGSDFADDAAVYRLTDQLALVQTVDFLTPIVDDPFTFGQIAVANSLSDVYAVGGTPLTALNIVTFPVGDLPTDVLGEILRGGGVKAAEAGVAIVGGHTVEDVEPKYGLAVTGTVHPDRFISNKGAKAGDLLVLTKPIGTGVIATANKALAASEADMKQAVMWMLSLNRQASVAMLAAGAHAATDITGFGLLGHLRELCRSSSVSAGVDVGAVPLLPGALQYARGNFVSAGTHSNLEAIAGSVEFSDDVDELERILLADAQTSGGLLVALSEDSVPTFRQQIGEDGLTAVIGRIEDGDSGTIRVARRGSST